MSKSVLVELLLRLTPSRWRDSIAGDFVEDGRGVASTAWHGMRVVARLWIEELRLSARPRRRNPRTRMSKQFQVGQAYRALVKRPVYSLATIATLAIGIGANASVFGLANWLMLRPLPAVQQPDRLVTIRFVHPSGGTFVISHPVVEEARQRVASLSDVAGSVDDAFSVSATPGQSERLDGALVSSNYFALLGVRPAIGRAFSDAEPGVVVSHAYWRTRLAEAPDVVGRRLLVNGTVQPVLGVAPMGFTGISRGETTDIWVPSTLAHSVLNRYTRDPLSNIRAGLYFTLVGRMAPDASVRRVQNDLEQLPSALRSIDPGFRRFHTNRFIAEAGLTESSGDRERMGRTFGLLLATGVLLLILTCANVSNLMLAVGSGRRVELATRQALGASRRRIAAEVTLESMFLALGGAAAAVALAAGVSALLRGAIVLPSAPALGDITIDIRVFAFALALAALSAIGAGLVPALAAARLDPLATLKGGGRSVSGAGVRMRRMLTIAQVALSVTLLVGGLLLTRSVDARRTVDTGFSLEPLITFSVDPGMQGHDRDRRQALYANLIERVRSTPGVEAAAFGWSRPFAPMAAGLGYGAPDTAADAGDASYYFVGPGYFETMGIRLLAGRAFAEADRPANDIAGETVVIVSDSIARRLFGSAQAAVGRRLAVSFPEGSHRQIVGVVADARLTRPFEPAPDAIFAPFGSSTAWATVHVRAAGNPGALEAALLEAVRHADPVLPVYDMFTAGESIERRMSDEIMVGRLTLGFALIAALLAAVGLYGVLAQGVSERHVEIGIRTALGAAPAGVMRVVTSEALRMTLTGAAAGTALALWLGRFIESRLYGVDRVDPAVFAMSLSVILATSLAAAVVPALRAARVDPVTALRQ